MNKKETAPASRCAAALLLFSLLAAVLGFAMPVQAAGNDGKALRTVRVGYYAYTGYNMMDADGNRSGYAYDMLQRIGQCENVQFEYLGYDGDTKQAMTMLEMANKQLIPAATAYMSDVASAAAAKMAVSEKLSCKAENKVLEKLSAATDAMSDAVDALDAAVESAESETDSLEKAKAYRDKVLPAMADLRTNADAAEVVCGEDYWPLPSYSKMLYYV